MYSRRCLDTIPEYNENMYHTVYVGLALVLGCTPEEMLLFYAATHHGGGIPWHGNRNPRWTQKNHVVPP